MLDDLALNELDMVMLVGLFKVTLTGPCSVTAPCNSSAVALVQNYSCSEPERLRNIGDMALTTPATKVRSGRHARGGVSSYGEGDTDMEKEDATDDKTAGDGH